MRENLSKEFLDEITNDLVGLVYKSFKENEKYKDLKDSTIDWLIREVGGVLTVLLALFVQDFIIQLMK